MIPIAHTLGGSGKRIRVKLAYYKKLMREVDGYTSCSPFFHICRLPHARQWQIIHVPTGRHKMDCDTLTQARYMCGIFSGLGFDWNYPDKWPKWQENHSWLMPWFRATDQLLMKVG